MPAREELIAHLSLFEDPILAQQHADNILGLYKQEVLFEVEKQMDSLLSSGEEDFNSALLSSKIATTSANPVLPQEPKPPTPPPFIPTHAPAPSNPSIAPMGPQLLQLIAGQDGPGRYTILARHPTEGNRYIAVHGGNSSYKVKFYPNLQAWDFNENVQTLVYDHGVNSLVHRTEYVRVVANKDQLAKILALVRMKDLGEIPDALALDEYSDYLGQKVTEFITNGWKPIVAEEPDYSAYSTDEDEEENEDGIEGVEDEEDEEENEDEDEDLDEEE
jgi:hypothetical protein